MPSDRDRALTGAMPENTQEIASLKVQQAVKHAGGLQYVVDQIHGGWGDLAAPGRRAGIERDMAAKLRLLDHIQATDPENSQAAGLRASLEHYSRELRDVIRENEAFSRRTAHACVMGAMGGEPYWLKSLATHAARVNAAFAEAVAAAL